MPSEGAARCDPTCVCDPGCACAPACLCDECKTRSEVEAGLFDLVEDGVLALRVDGEGKMVFVEAYEGALLQATVGGISASA